MENAGRILVILTFLAALSLIAALIFRPELFLGDPRAGGPRQTRVVIPRLENAGQAEKENVEREIAAFEDSMNAKIALNPGELLISALTQDFDGDLVDEQIIAYRNLSKPDSPVFLSYIVFDRTINGYTRVWDAPTVVTAPGTLSLYTRDITGDRSVCIIITGMNSNEDRTMTIFKRNMVTRGEPFRKIAEIEIDGSIQLRESERTEAYSMGLTSGESFTIAAYGRDTASDNILDQIEITYEYNPITGRFERTRLNRLPGSQIEQRRVRELLSGGAKQFAEFLGGVWYYVSPQGTLDTRQYIYFDPLGREFIFYGDEVQQVFIWQNSSATRYGLYISGQNISITNLRRAVDIELESLNSIRVKVFEDVRLKIGVGDSWHGSYRKADTQRGGGIAGENGPGFPGFYIDAVYNGIIGRLVFSKNGEYELHTENDLLKGTYAFFTMETRPMLELRPGPVSGLPRETYFVEGASGENPRKTPWKAITLVRVRLSTQGFREVYEASISLSLAEEG